MSLTPGSGFDHAPDDPPDLWAAATTDFDVPRAGIDWATTDHAACVIDLRGRVIDRVTVPHDKAGLATLVTALLKHQVVEVGIERGDGPLVEALMAAGFVLFVIPPSKIKNLRSRYGSAGNKDDRFDAFVLADTVRTDRVRLTPLTRSTAATVVLRDTVRARKDLVAARVAVHNQLQAHLEHVFPGVLGLFRDLDNQIGLTFLDRFPTQVQADWLTVPRLAAWLKTHSYPHARAEKLLAHLNQAPTGLTSPGARECAPAHAAITRSYVAVLETLNAQIRALHESIEAQLAAHPDRDLFAALPRTQALRQARLIGEIGDARGRFPTAQALSCLAGVVPSTRQSGKSKVIAFRWGVDKQLRDAICDFAGDSRLNDPWAADLYNRARARGHEHNHAVRILARAWVDIIWRCWHDKIPYDPARHNALQRVRNSQRIAA